MVIRRSEKFDDIFSRFDTLILRRTGRDILRQHSPRYAYASRGKNLGK